LNARDILLLNADWVIETRASLTEGTESRVPGDGEEVDLVSLGN